MTDRLICFLFSFGQDVECMSRVPWPVLPMPIDVPIGKEEPENLVHRVKHYLPHLKQPPTRQVLPHGYLLFYNLPNRCALAPSTFSPCDDIVKVCFCGPGCPFTIHPIESKGGTWYRFHHHRCFQMACAIVFTVILGSILFLLFSLVFDNQRTSTKASLVEKSSIFGFFGPLDRCNGLLGLITFRFG